MEIYLKARYKAGTLAEIEHVLDEIYARFKREDEERRQQERIDEEVQKAVEREREIWQVATWPALAQSDDNLLAFASL